MQKTTFQNWLDKNYATKKMLHEDTGIPQDVISRDYQSKNGLLKLMKYAIKLKEKGKLKHDFVEYEGFEHGAIVSGTMRIKI